MILTHQDSFPSAKILRNSIAKELGWDKKELLVTKNPNRISTLHVRYGNSSSTRARNSSNVLNSQTFIKTCAHKREMVTRIMKGSKKSIPSTEFISLSKRLPTNDEFPFLVRETLTSGGSKGILLFQEFEDFLDALGKGVIKYGSYWSPYIVFSEEYRVHVLGGKIGKIFRKELNDAEKVENIYIRNNDNSHFYRLKIEKTPKSVRGIVKNFHDFYKGNFRGESYFTALDIGIRANDDNAVFIEANTAPGLNEATADVYAKFIIANSSAFAVSEKEVGIIQALKEQTKSLNNEWALRYE